VDEAQPNGIIALLTDFGLHDGYVAAMKGVVLSIAPHARLIDVSHDVAAHNIAEGAFLLQSVVPYYPPGTIFVAVIDPGVGTARRALAIRTDRAFLIGPDNGLLAAVADTTRYRAPVEIVELTEQHYWREHISATFHGRDIFAPVAAHLVAGVPFGSLGRTVEQIVPSVLEAPRHHHSGIVEGMIVHVDRFGNCVTNITGADLAAYRSAEDTLLVVELAGQRVPGLYTTYGAGPVGVPMALLGSSDHLEIAVRNTPASQWFGVTVGDRVRVLPVGDPLA
jgi:S-adenosyl-L-methionine hydrolase (adenosine-forming)